ncbi:hypothetical protein Lfu02_02330 [Longispora fulva]|nr:hypothetical protein Lfu02_02330 [Longispora fulva]
MTDGRRIVDGQMSERGQSHACSTRERAEGPSMRIAEFPVSAARAGVAEALTEDMATGDIRTLWSVPADPMEVTP